MLGIGFPDRHALPRINPIKSADPQRRSPPARAGSFYGATSPFGHGQVNDRSPHPKPTPTQGTKRQILPATGDGFARYVGGRFRW